MSHPTHERAGTMGSLQPSAPQSTVSMMPSPFSASATTPRPPPVRKTYGKKRFLAHPTGVESDLAELPAKRHRTMSSPPKGDNRPSSGAQPPLQNIPVNAPSRLLGSSPLYPRPPSRLVSPTKPPRRGTFDQNALDSPFLEPRKPTRSPGFVLGSALRRTSSSVKPKLSTRSRHLSLNRPNSNLKARTAKETSAEALRRKTSEATTALGTTLTEHSWLVPPPPRVPLPRGALRVDPDSPAFDFSFDPPAESTIAHMRRPTHTPPPGAAENPVVIDGSDETPIARRPSLQDEIMAALPPRDMGRHRKRHDSILSSDSEDLGTTFSIFGLTPKPKLADIPPEDPDATPRNLPSLMEQLCGQRSRSGSVSVRPLSQDIPTSARLLHSSSDADDEMAEGPLPRQDASVRALADACAEIDLGDDSSPSRLIKAASKGKRRAGDSKNKRTPVSATVQRTRHSDKPYQLSPGTVHHLSKQRRVGMRISDRPLSPNDDVDMFASYEFDRGVLKDTSN